MNKIDAVCAILISFYLIINGAFESIRSLLIGREKYVMKSVKEYLETLNMTRFIQKKAVYLLSFATIQTMNVIAIAYSIIAVKNNFVPYWLIGLWLLSILFLNSRITETYKIVCFGQKIHKERLKTDWYFHNAMSAFNVLIGTLFLKGMIK